MYIWTHTHTHNVIIQSHKKEENLAICGNMDDGPLFMLNKINQMEKDKHCMISLIWGI